MPKRSSKPPADVNRAALAILQAATDEPMIEKLTPTEKNPAAVELGRRGGLKGGKARAAALPADERKRIAHEAARKRWGPPKGDSVE